MTARARPSPWLLKFSLERMLSLSGATPFGRSRQPLETIKEKATEFTNLRPYERARLPIARLSTATITSVTAQPRTRRP
jgi:hypothetical protein